MQILSRTVMMISVLLLPGCVDSIPLEPSHQEPSTKVEKVVTAEPELEPKRPILPSDEKPPQPSPEELAREKLKLGLDAWMFGDSFKKFGQDHPEISFFDTSWGFGEALLRYDIGHARTMEYKGNDGTTTYNTEFVVTIIQTTRSGDEVKKNKNYSVSSPRANSGQWIVTGLSQ